MSTTNGTTPAPESATNQPLELEEALDLIQELLDRVRQTVLARQAEQS